MNYFKLYLLFSNCVLTMKMIFLSFSYAFSTRLFLWNKEYLLYNSNFFYIFLCSKLVNNILYVQINNCFKIFFFAKEKKTKIVCM